MTWSFTAAQNLGIEVSGSTSSAGLTRDLIRQAIGGLPDELRPAFEERLGALGKGTSGLGTLARDIALAGENHDLQDEMLRLVRQTNFRQALYDQSEPVGKAGLGTKALRTPARAVLSWTDVVAPTELRFQYQTANDAAHATLRSQAVARLSTTSSGSTRPSGTGLAARYLLPWSKAWASRVAGQMRKCIAAAPPMKHSTTSPSSEMAAATCPKLGTQDVDAGGASGGGGLAMSPSLCRHGGDPMQGSLPQSP